MIEYTHVEGDTFDAHVNGATVRVTRGRERGYESMPGAVGNGRPHLAEYWFAARALGDKPLTVLDIACGSGYGTAVLREAGHVAVGADVSTEALAFARAAYPNGSFIEQDMGDVPWVFPSGSFDTVVSVEAIEHTTRYREALREMHRVLKPGGQLIVTTPQGSPWKPLSPHHVKEWNMAEFAALLAEAGFASQRWQPHPHAWVVIAQRGPA